MIAPLIDTKVGEKVEAHIADAVKKAVKVVTGGKRGALDGTLFEPTVLTDVTTDMVTTKGETLGPVAPPCRFKSDAEAMAKRHPVPDHPRLRGRGGRGLAVYFTAATSAASCFVGGSGGRLGSVGRR